MDIKAEKPFIRTIRNSIIWIIIVVIVWYFLVSGTAEWLFTEMILRLRQWSPAMHFIHEYYTGTIMSVIVLILICLIVRRNRFILRAFLPAGTEKDYKMRVIEDSYQPSRNNTAKTLLLGLLLGFLTNFACIACALIHGDIKLYYDFSPSQIPVLIFAFLMVFVQSASEEMWCRGFMYERINVRHPLWVSIAVNGVFFGLMHMFNDGVSFLAILSICICGLSYSLLRWYTGSMWTAMGIHAMWNFTQNFIFGLPNSGLVSEVSVLHLDAATGISNLIYNYEFGVEGALPAVMADAAVGIAALLLARRDGRLGELLMSYEKKTGSNE